MSSVSERRCCERVNGFIKNNGIEGAKVAATAGVVTMACGPVIAGLGITGYSGYKIYKSLKAAPKEILIPNISKYDRCFRSELFKRLPPSVSEDIKQRVERLPMVTKGKIRVLRDMNVNNPFFKEPNWTDFAMKAYLENQIDASTLHRLMILAACQNESGGDVESVKVLEPGGIEILKQALSYQRPLPDDDEKGEPQPIDRFLTDKQWDQLLRNLRRTPEKAQLFLIPYPNSNDNLEVMNLLNNVKAALGKPYIFAVNAKTGLKMAIMPPDLLMEILKAKYGEENVPEALNIFGERNIEKLSGNSRPVRIPCYPYLPCPKVIHGNVVATDLAYYLHDISYHLPIEASMGKEHRDLWIDLAKWVKPKSQAAFLDVLDKDMIAYSKEDDPYTKSERFWFAFANLFNKHSLFITWICIYISQNPNRCEGVNVEGFRQFYQRFGHKNFRFADIKKSFEFIEQYPGIVQDDYNRHKASVS